MDYVSHKRVVYSFYLAHPNPADCSEGLLALLVISVRSMHAA